MKYCPFCGADLLSPEVSFCAECGKQLPAGNAPQTEPENRQKPVENQRNSKKKPAPVRPKQEPKKPGHRSKALRRRSFHLGLEKNSPWTRSLRTTMTAITTTWNSWMLATPDRVWIAK